MLKSLWVGLSVVVWLVMCVAFAAALATWATAAEPVSVASWRPAPVALPDIGVPTLQPLSVPAFSAVSWRPNNPVIAPAPPVSLASWRPAQREVTTAPSTPPPAVVAATGYWQTQCTKKGCRLVWVSLR
ncbi:MAG: hypothetical protein Q8N17_11855 [Burkholderiaceae bacterium]|nr:hypothetical protein [Burkholderiaceae bacterium]